MRIRYFWRCNANHWSQNPFAWWFSSGLSMLNTVQFIRKQEETGSKIDNYAISKISLRKQWFHVTMNEKWLILEGMTWYWMKMIWKIWISIHFHSISIILLHILYPLILIAVSFHSLSREIIDSALKCLINFRACSV